MNKHMEAHNRIQKAFAESLRTINTPLHPGDPSREGWSLGYKNFTKLSFKPA